jgi:hypothetical protein
MSAIHSDYICDYCVGCKNKKPIRKHLCFKGRAVVEGTPMTLNMAKSTRKAMSNSFWALVGKSRKIAGATKKGKSWKKTQSSK